MSTGVKYGKPAQTLEPVLRTPSQKAVAEKSSPAKGILKNEYNLPIEKASRVRGGCFPQSENDLDDFRIRRKE